ncbi:UBX3 UBX domain-containing protein 3 [Candida maltosa Xu316]
MSSSFPNWVRDYFRPSTANYTPVTGSNTNNSESNLPGAFPQEESATQNPRSIFNSHSLNNGFQKITYWLNYILIQPLIIVLVIIFRVLSTILNIVYFQSSSSSTTQETVDPVSKASKFIRELEENLERSTPDDSERLPPFLLSSYTQALYLAKTRAKFMFIYISNGQKDEIFNKIITNENFLKLFQNNSNLIIWGGDVRNSEAYQVGNSLNVTKYPFLGLLCLTRTTKMTPQGPAKTPAKISLVAKLQGNVKCTPKLLDDKFIKKMKKYEKELKQMREELFLKDKIVNRNQQQPQ